MKNCLVYTICIILATIVIILVIHYVSISFKADKSRQELYKNLDEIVDSNGMIVDISDCLETEWDSIYVIGRYCDSLELKRVIPSQYKLAGNNYNNSIIVLKSGKVKYINYIRQDGFTTPRVRFYIPNDGNFFLVTHEDNYEFIVWNDRHYYVLFPAKECIDKDDNFFWNNLDIAYDDRLFIEKFLAFLDGDIVFKELIE